MLTTYSETTTTTTAESSSTATESSAATTESSTTASASASSGDVLYVSVAKVTSVDESTNSQRVARYDGYFVIDMAMVACGRDVHADDC